MTNITEPEESLNSNEVLVAMLICIIAGGMLVAFRTLLDHDFGSFQPLFYGSLGLSMVPVWIAFYVLTDRMWASVGRYGLPIVWVAGGLIELSAHNVFGSGQPGERRLFVLAAIGFPFVLYSITWLRVPREDDAPPVRI